ncbi:hypothetical protein [uncultured Clostridium sp.]|uniref:hypothetical protein n=1 Tax=uncultured Clostridium sp. TaxID=59620 RepID=UPI0028EC4013|nr:hypothetical protein [uncultured Clostridium sp.]
MDKKVSDFYSILKQEKDNIEKFSKIIKVSGELTKRINMVIGEMNSIKQDMMALEENINEEKVKTEDIENKVNNIVTNEIKDNMDTVVEILAHNLPKDVKAEFVKNSYEEFNKKVIDLMKFNNIIGEVIIYSNNNNELKINVKLWGGEEKVQEFTIKEKYRIFKVVSLIHTNLSYDE